MNSPNPPLDMLAMCTLFRDKASSSKDIFINYSHLVACLSRLKLSSTGISIDPSKSFIGGFANSRIVRTNILFQSSDLIDPENTLPSFYLSSTRITFLVIALARYILDSEPSVIGLIDKHKGDGAKIISEVYLKIQDSENFVNFLSLNVSFYDAKTLQDYMEKTIFQKYKTFEEILEKYETVYGTKYNFFR